MKTVSLGQVGTSELGLPPRVQETLGQLVGAAKEGLLALSTTGRKQWQSYASTSETASPTTPNHPPIHRKTRTTPPGRLTAPSRAPSTLTSSKKQPERLDNSVTGRPSRHGSPLTAPDSSSRPSAATLSPG
jgi:hypothetical protein